LKFIFYIIGYLVIATSVWGQQDSYLSMYQYHTNLFNPAYVDEDNIDIKTSYKQQWAGVENAPRLIGFSGLFSLNNSMGIGVNLLSNDVFIEKQTQIFITFAYYIKITNSINLSLGLQAGGNNLSLSLQDLERQNIFDPLAVNYSKFLPNVGAGINIKWYNLFLSLSAPKILETERVKTIEGFAAKSLDKIHIYAILGAKNIYLNDNFSLNTSALVRYVEGAPYSIIGSGGLGYQDLINFDIGYSSSNVFNVNLAFKINQFLLGYSYQLNNNSIASAVNTSSNEIILGINLFEQTNNSQSTKRFSRKRVVKSRFKRKRITRKRVKSEKKEITRNK